MAAEHDPGSGNRLTLVPNNEHGWPEDFKEVLGVVMGEAVSQKKFGDEVGLDHSTISRFRGGTRNPTRDTIQDIVARQGLSELEGDRLLASAGYRGNGNTIFHTEEAMLRLNGILRDGGVAEHKKEQIRMMLSYFLGSLAVENTPSEDTEQ